MKSIALILPYFGNLNRSGYFELFLESCKNNPTIDFLIYTDDRTQYDYSKNVKVKYTTFEGLKEKIQRLYEFPINLNHAYKLRHVVSVFQNNDRPFPDLLEALYLKVYDL